MMSLEDIQNIEGEAATPEDYFKSLQNAIDGGEGWKLQGSYGRAMMDAIECGHCMLGLSPTSDYWGNRIPSRHEVRAGTKGSREFVVAHHNEEWAEMLEAE